MTPLTPEAREHVKRAVAAAPPLRAEQKARLQELLRPVRRLAPPA
jgi:hypothetical protein